MKTRLIALLAACLLLASCGDGGDDTPETPGTTGATDRSAATGSPGGGGESQGEAAEVSPAPDGKVNTPKPGRYVYDYESESTDATKPDATPQRAEEGSTLTSTVTEEGEGEIKISDKSSQGPAVSSVLRRYEEERIVEVASEFQTSGQTGRCVFDPAIVMLRLPIEEGDIPSQELSGEGSNCGGSRTISVEGQEDVDDANGTSWSTWKITVTNRVGTTSRSTITQWFSPDLGMEIREETVAEALEDGKVTRRGESSSVLRSFPN